MKGIKRKDGTLEGKRRNKGVSNQVDSSNLSNENVSEMLGGKRKKLLDERKGKKNKAGQVDLSNVSNELEIKVGRKNTDDRLRKKKKKQNNQKIEPEEEQERNEIVEDDGLRKKKKKQNNQKIEPEEEQEHNEIVEDRNGEGTAYESERLVQNQMKQAFAIRKKDVALRKNKKKHKVQKFITEEEQKCNDDMEDHIEEGNVDENGKMEQKQRKANKKKRRNETITELNMGKTKKFRDAETVEQLQPQGEQDLPLEKKEEEDEIYQIPSEDENSSHGMRKWLAGYYQSRPGLTVLQENIDDFITAHEAQEEQARIEREEKAADGGWTVVVHHKGRKKTTDAESGIAVGSVSQAAVMDKMDKKKIKDVGDFYRFQKREAKRNEIAMLQSKFEQDKKRMQELRAQRKFRPY